VESQCRPNKTNPTRRRGGRTRNHKPLKRMQPGRSRRPPRLPRHVKPPPAPRRRRCNVGVEVGESRRCRAFYDPAGPFTSSQAQAGIMIRRNINCLLLAWVAACFGLAGPASGQQNRQAGRQGQGGVELPQGMTRYETRYYVVYSDLEPEDVKDVALRMTKMAEEYYERTKTFSGVIRQKFPFYLFKDAEDYYAAGAPVGSAGVFMVRGHDARLMAIAGERGGGSSAHVVQHEGFHQFAHAVIGGDIPTWVNEGLAEYFGESVFTGDGFVTGVIPPNRMKRVQEKIRGKQFRSIKDMMLLSHAQWNSGLSTNNYDQAWSMVHFLAHGDNGAYQKAFSNFMNDIGRRKPWQDAWQANFGPADGFEKKWADWWLALPPNPTSDLYARATVATLTSYLGRLAAQKQTFTELDAFVRAAEAGEVKLPLNDDWLPPGLLQDAIAWLGRDKNVEFALENEPAPAPADPKAGKTARPTRDVKVVKPPRVVATLPDKTRIVGTYHPKAATGRVTVEVDDFVTVLEKAKKLLADQKKDQARALLQDALKRVPRSPLAEEARKLLLQAK
jgi:hypothetical protein